MTFLVYHVIIHHSCILSTIRTMSYVDFRDFPNDPYYFGFNSAGQKNLVLVFLVFKSYRT
jgi:hypothetical protein